MLCFCTITFNPNTTSEILRKLGSSLTGSYNANLETIESDKRHKAEEAKAAEAQAAFLASAQTALQTTTQSATKSAATPSSPTSNSEFAYSPGDMLTIQPVSTRVEKPYMQNTEETDRNISSPNFEIFKEIPNFAKELNEISDANKVDTKNRSNTVQVDFNVGVNKSVVSEKSLNILKQVSRASGNNHINISSTLRSPAKQAEVMYNANLTKGFADQYNLYGSKGDQVIRIHENNKDKQKEEIIELMTSKINQLTPSEVSKHCGNHSDVNVFDISIKNLKNPDLFYNELLKLEGSLISKIIDERDRGCIHVEIKQ